MVTITGLLIEGDSIPNNADSYFYQYLGVASGAANVPASFNGVAGNQPANLAYSWYSGNIIGHNCAVGGSRLQTNSFDLVQRASIWVDPFWPRAAYAGTARKYILVVAVGTNDQFTNGVSVASYVTDLLAYCAARKAAALAAYSGNQVKVLLCTGLPRGDGISNETNRTAFNAILNGVGWASTNNIDGIIDLASQPIMGLLATCSDTTYFLADKVHPTRPGHTLLLPIFSAAMSAAL